MNVPVACPMRRLTQTPDSHSRTRWHIDLPVEEQASAPSRLQRYGCKLSVADFGKCRRRYCLCFRAWGEGVCMRSPRRGCWWRQGWWRGGLGRGLLRVRSTQSPRSSPWRDWRSAWHRSPWRCGRSGRPIRMSLSLRSDWRWRSRMRKPMRGSSCWAATTVRSMCSSPFIRRQRTMPPGRRQRHAGEGGRLLPQAGAAPDGDYRSCRVR